MNPTNEELKIMVVHEESDPSKTPATKFIVMWLVLSEDEEYSTLMTFINFGKSFEAFRTDFTDENMKKLRNAANEHEIEIKKKCELLERQTIEEKWRMVWLEITKDAKYRIAKYSNKYLKDLYINDSITYY